MPTRPPPTRSTQRWPTSPTSSRRGSSPPRGATPASCSPSEPAPDWTLWSAGSAPGCKPTSYCGRGRCAGWTSRSRPDNPSRAGKSRAMHEQPDSSLFFVGTATTVVRRDGFTVITDPNFLRRGQRAYLGKGLSSKRLTEPAITVDEVPRLDAVALSHLHGDHYDRVTRKGLDPSVPVVTTTQGAKRLRKRGVSTTGLRTWEPWETT